MARNATREPAEEAGQDDLPKGRIRQFIQAYKVYREIDPKLKVSLIGWGAGSAIVAFALIFLLTGGNIISIVLGAVLALAFGLTAALTTLNRRGQRAVYGRWEGQPGAAGQALQQGLRRGWQMTPAVQLNRQQDMVHRLIGRGGVLLVAEGDPARVAQLVTTERKNLARLLGPEVEPEVIVVGNDTTAGQVPLAKLVPNVTRRGLRGRNKLTDLQTREYAKRLAAIDRGPLAGRLPKGPLPRGGRMPRGNIR
jgi:hypothetical protein